MATPESELWRRLRRLTEPEGAGETAAVMGASMLPGVGTGMDAVDLAAGLQDRDLLRAGIGAVGLALPIVTGAHLKALKHGIGRFLKNQPAVLEQAIRTGPDAGSNVRHILTKNTKSGMMRGERDWRLSIFVDDEPIGHRSFALYDSAFNDIKNEAAGGYADFLDRSAMRHGYTGPRIEVEKGDIRYIGPEPKPPAGHGMVTDLNAPVVNETADEFTRYARSRVGQSRAPRVQLADGLRGSNRGIASLPGVSSAMRRSWNRSLASTMPTADDIARGRSLYDPHALANYDPYKDWYSHSILIDMDPRDFRRLSDGQPLANTPKLRNLEDMVREGIGFNEIPYLTTDPRGNGLVYVSGHEGRHRSLLASQMGMRSMPVRIYGNFDMYERYGFDPMYLKGQDDRWFMPFPFSREELARMGRPSTRAESPMTKAPPRTIDQIWRDIGGMGSGSSSGS